MAKSRRVRRIYSVSGELLTKSREAALAAVQIFNNPLITFKSEIFIVLMNIAWTYLLHAYYRKHHIEYRYYQQRAKRRVFDKTKSGAHKHWELERCLNDQQSPIDKDTANNLRFLIGIRHEIEHQMTSRLDSSLSAKFQACCLNYNEYVKKLFGEKFGIDKHLAFSLQFSSISREQVAALPSPSKMPSHIKAFIDGFEGKLADEEFNSPRFAYRVLFIAKTANRKGQADQVIEFVKSDSSLAEKINAEYTVIKETEKPKYLPSQIVELMRKEGFPKFSMHYHTQLWKQLDAKKPGKGYGTKVAGKYWHWYERWVAEVRKHCQLNADKYGAKA
ncbi:MAG: DUF3644 domain-containing protein [Deltaproteobacteria bacterium]|nr:DUF3644 domain-containing protein [Deltaproteobacteria bacterium]MBW1924535.1 DUF3644 domain-containing protein [Deltaproteobacteria bacterium]MBW2009434.1 DUF3644 domain-containing protein [Deltaproteobacteria bacterium]